MKALLTRRLPGDVLGPLREHYEVTLVDRGRPLTAEELQRSVGDCEVLLCTLTDRIDAALLAQAPQLKLVVSFSAGLDHIDRSALAKGGVRLTYTPGELVGATAQLTWALILACARRLRPATLQIEEGGFTGFDPCQHLGKGLSGGVLGIVGMGRIGRAVSQIARAFGMDVIYHHPRPIGDTVAGARQVPFAEVLTRSDVLSLHCSLNDSTRQLIGRRELGLMKKDAIFINTARGAMVDEQALVAHLRTHPGFHAGLDVFENEPYVPAELFSLPNAYCLPHIGSATVEVRTRMAETCVQEAIRFRKREALLNEVPL